MVRERKREEDEEEEEEERDELASGVSATYRSRKR